MEWVKLSATPAYYLDGALLRAGEAAEVLFCRGLAYCGTVESAGVIDKTVLPMLVQKNGPARAAALVREGLWLDEGNTWRIRSWDKWQDEHDVAAEKRRKDRERQREHRRKSREDEDTSRDGHADLSRDSHSDKRDCHDVDVEGEVEKEQKRPAKPSAPPRLDVEQVCTALAEAVERNGSNRPTVTEKWRTDARLMLDRDRRSLADVLAVIDWSADHAFWRTNILSVPKLREQFDKLRLQREADRPTPIRPWDRIPAGQEHLPEHERFRAVSSPDGGTPDWTPEELAAP